MNLFLNWLPRDAPTTSAVAAAVADGPWAGIGVCDSPNYDECYTSMSRCLSETENLSVCSNVTNPVTRHATVHAAAVRSLGRGFAGRVMFGIGRGDSAVRTHGLRPATTAEVSSAVRTMRAAAAECPSPPSVLVAAAGPRTAAIAGQHADGLIAGAGADLAAIAQVADWSGRGLDDPDFAVWATVRLGIAADPGDVPALRRRFVARALSAARFNLGRWFDGKGVPDEYERPLRDAFDRYDFDYHGVAADNPNLTLLSDRPDIEEWLVDRYVVVGTCEQVVDRLAAFQNARCAGVFCSILFEDPAATVRRLNEHLRPVIEPPTPRSSLT